LQPNGIAASDFARGRLARPKNCAARSRAAQPSSSPIAGLVARRAECPTCPCKSRFGRLDAGESLGVLGARAPAIRMSHRYLFIAVRAANSRTHTAR
jgi:hypothetical protein